MQNSSALCTFASRRPSTPSPCLPPHRKRSPSQVRRRRPKRKCSRISCARIQIQSSQARQKNSCMPTTSRRRVRAYAPMSPWRRLTRKRAALPMAVTSTGSRTTSADLVQPAAAQRGFRSPTCRQACVPIYSICSLTAVRHHPQCLSLTHATTSSAQTAPTSTDVSRVGQS